MSAGQRAGILEELERERRLLVKADVDIVEGTARVRNQQELLAQLSAQAGGAKEVDVIMARRLLQGLDDTLYEWKCHRVLILQRIAYLERKAAE